MLSMFARLHRQRPGAHFTGSTQPPLLEDFPAYEKLIGRLSAGLPGDQQFHYRNFIRQLGTVTRHIAMAAGSDSPDSPVTQVLHDDLYLTTLRGIAYSLAGVQYHAHGLGLGQHRPAAADVLAYVRLKKHVNRRNIQRKVYFLNAENLGHLLERWERYG